MTGYTFKEVETQITKLWNTNKIYQKAKQKTKGKELFYFLDGPPYTSGKVHLGTAWNKALKDLILRYKRMNNFDVWDRAGYDMHGLPTAHAVQKKLNLKTKEDILKFGMDNFVKECIKLSTENLAQMNKDFQKEGVWMDFENAYQTIDPELIDGEWWLVKEAHNKKRLYEGLKTMHWCYNCETSLAKHELAYQIVHDDSIFVKFPVKGKENEFIIIWTTTPWTIPFNLGVMVHPELDYVKAKVDNEIWIVAKALAASFIQGVVDKPLEIIQEFKGQALENYEYIHPFEQQLKSHYDELRTTSKIHRVVFSTEYVDTSAGTGIVHMAPGCGPEDFEVGHRNKIPAYNTLSEDGHYPENYGNFSKFHAKKDNAKFTEELKKLGALITTTKVEHDYAFCDRCKNPIIYRTTKQWFFKVEDIKEKMLEFNKEISWVPQTAHNAFNSWLSNLRDNGITRQTYWGTPAPIWRCDSCTEIEVIGSIQELKEKATKKLPANIHKPWIDNVKLSCKCGKTMTRIPDILDVWVDAGVTSWTSLGFPRQKELFNKLFPADFILEGKDQIRGWFNLLMVASILGHDKPSFKAVYMHGFINDAQGRKMSKSLGNYILPAEVYDEFGVDTFRYYSIGCANPGMDMNYNKEDVLMRHRNLMVLWNLHTYLLNLIEQHNLHPKPLDKATLAVEERFILSLVETTKKELTNNLNNYRLNTAPDLIEQLYLEISRTYIQFVREKATNGSTKEKQAVINTLFKALYDTIQMFSIVCPFITESIYQNLKQPCKLKEESIHLTEWPQPNEEYIDVVLEESLKAAQELIGAILSARDKAKIGVRWPLPNVTIECNQALQQALEQHLSLIQNQTNIKKITFDNLNLTYAITPNTRTIGKEFGHDTAEIIELIQQNQKPLNHAIKNNETIILKKHTLKKEHFQLEPNTPEQKSYSAFKGGELLLHTEQSEELLKEGYLRELIRRIQSLRKKAGLKKSNTVILSLAGDLDLSKELESQKNKIGVTQITFAKTLNKSEHSSKEKIKEKEFQIGITQTS
ncbi:isoleucine--tRNA ligase [Candidatus Woesearchaeota archaeon]|nr:isoleucine--tRNA ligase [Candidatus Woesearchaeota archaeon]